MKFSPSLFLLLAVLACSTEKESDKSLHKHLSSLLSLEGKAQYLSSPYVTAGDRVYMVGYQDGGFPDLGWHVTGEMGGIWDHPIKLMDGFAASLNIQGNSDFFCLDKAQNFTNYPLANRHHFNWAEQNITVDRVQFVPDSVEGIVIEFRIANSSAERKQLVFSFTGMTDLRPTWLGERTNMIDAEDEVAFDEDLFAVVAKDKNNPWHTMFGSTIEATFSSEQNKCSTNRKGSGKDATLTYSFTVEGNKYAVIPIFIAGSYQSEEAVRSTYDLLKKQYIEKFRQKAERYQKINRTSQLIIADKDIQQMYEWLKYNTDWLTRHVPEQGRGLSAGLPDYPWWFGADATYALQGVLATGDHELAKHTIELLHSISQKTNDNGRVIHEVSTNGSVYNKGNLNETAQFITLVNTYYAWTGDLELVKRFFPDLKKGMDWLLKERDADGNHYPNGSGMMEIPGLESELEMIDVAVYTQQALESVATLAYATGEDSLAAVYQKLADEQKVKINKEWWNAAENSFGDFRGTAAEAMPILNAALIRSDTLQKKWALTELKNAQRLIKQQSAQLTLPQVIYHNWVVNTPMETGIADANKAQAALKKAKTYENPFGVFVTGIDRTEEADSVVLKSRKKIFSYTGAVMTLPTSVLAVSAARYGNADEALAYIKKLHQSFSYALPGSMYEVSPDFGMMTQAWNIYGVAVPVVHYFFGIHPAAQEKTIRLSPHLPAAWKEAALDNVRVGNNSFSLSIRRENNYTEYQISQTVADWTIVVDVKEAKKIVVNDAEVNPATIKGHQLQLTGKKNVVRLY